MAWLLTSQTAGAGLVFTISANSVPADSTGLATFSGQITNQTGVDLSSTDLFLNFSGFDPIAVSSITQVLGSFTLPDTITSPIEQLFAVQMSTSAASGSYPIDVSLQDINNNLSNSITVNVVVSGSASVPEPGGVTFILIAGLAAAVAGRPHRTRARSTTAPS